MFIYRIHISEVLYALFREKRFQQGAPAGFLAALIASFSHSNLMDMLGVIATVMGMVVAGLSAYKVFQDIKINRMRLREMEGKKKRTSKLNQG